MLELTRCHFSKSLSLLLFSCLFSFSCFSKEQGALVMAGGAISENSRIIFEEFVRLSGAEKAKIVVVPAATSSVARQFTLLQEQFSGYGAKSDNIVLLPLATKDDKSTESLDESSWISNGNSDAVIKLIGQSNAVWFIGGDQTLITRVLLNKDGSDSKALSAIRAVYRNGGVIGGTSAGAAIMSELMIAGGNSEGALLEGTKTTFSSMQEQEFGPLVTKTGLGFFKEGIIDQHFDRKARLGRLILTLLLSPKHNLGFGIDEGTALILEKGRLRAIGEGGVTLVNTSKVTGFTPNQYPVEVKNVRLGFMQPGDSYSLQKGQMIASDEASKTSDKPYFDMPALSVSGMMSANRNLDEFIGYNLVDNKGTSKIRSWIKAQDTELELLFIQDNDSQGFWRLDLTKDVYSFDNIRLDIAVTE